MRHEPAFPVFLNRCPAPLAARRGSQSPWANSKQFQPEQGKNSNAARACSLTLVVGIKRFSFRIGKTVCPGGRREFCLAALIAATD